MSTSVHAFDGSIWESKDTFIVVVVYLFCEELQGEIVDSSWPVLHGLTMFKWREYYFLFFT